MAPPTFDEATEQLLSTSMKRFQVQYQAVQQAYKDMTKNVRRRDVIEWASRVTYYLFLVAVANQLTIWNTRDAGWTPYNQLPYIDMTVGYIIFMCVQGLLVLFFVLESNCSQPSWSAEVQYWRDFMFKTESGQTLVFNWARRITIGTTLWYLVQGGRYNWQSTDLVYVVMEHFLFKFVLEFVQGILRSVTVCKENARQGVAMEVKDAKMMITSFERYIMPSWSGQRLLTMAGWLMFFIFMIASASHISNTLKRQPDRWSENDIKLSNGYNIMAIMVAIIQGLEAFFLVYISYRVVGARDWIPRTYQGHAAIMDITIRFVVGGLVWSYIQNQYNPNKSVGLDWTVMICCVVGEGGIIITRFMYMGGWMYDPADAQSMTDAINEKSGTLTFSKAIVRSTAGKTAMQWPQSISEFFNKLLHRPSREYVSSKPNFKVHGLHETHVY